MWYVHLCVQCQGEEKPVTFKCSSVLDRNCTHTRANINIHTHKMGQLISHLLVFHRQIACKHTHTYTCVHTSSRVLHALTHTDNYLHIHIYAQLLAHAHTYTQVFAHEMSRSRSSHWYKAEICTRTHTYNIYIYIGLTRTIYIRCIYGIFGRNFTKYTVYKYGSGQPYIYI